MQGIVTLLDGEARERIEEIWEELRRDFGVRGVHATRFPHFSYHVAEEYELGRLAESLEKIARELRPFSVAVSGMGIFTRKLPVIYLPVVRSLEMQRIHGEVAEMASDLASGVNEFYASEVWIPHITVAEGDVDLLVLPEIVRRFGERNLRWEMRVANLAVIRAEEAVQEVCVRVEFGA